MLDSTLRPVKDRLLAPLVRTPIGHAAPVVLSTIGLACGLGAAIAAWQHVPALAVALWLLGRLADGLDGLTARATGTASDLGGLVDIVFDTIVYAAVPIGLAFALDERAVWIATAVLLATFYVNVTSWAYLSALLEKRRHLDHATTTSVAMPRGLVEGTETIVLFTIVLALPDSAITVWWIMSAAVAVTAAERLLWAVRVLR